MGGSSVQDIEAKQKILMDLIANSTPSPVSELMAEYESEDNRAGDLRMKFRGTRDITKIFCDFKSIFTEHRKIVELYMNSLIVDMNRISILEKQLEKEDAEAEAAGEEDDPDNFVLPTLPTLPDLDEYPDTSLNPRDFLTKSQYLDKMVNYLLPGYQKLLKQVAYQLRSCENMLKNCSPIGIEGLDDAALAILNGNIQLFETHMGEIEELKLYSIPCLESTLELIRPKVADLLEKIEKYEKK